jgi:hypothetical protein
MIFGRQKQNNGHRLKKTEQISDGKFIYQYRLKKATKISDGYLKKQVSSENQGPKVKTVFLQSALPSEIDTPT